MADAIYRGPKTGYTLTDEDMLWFARALGGETGGGATRQEAQWHFWCWMDRFHLVRGSWQGPTGVPIEGGFGRLLIQYHSKATSPLWRFTSSAKCRQYPDDCTPSRLAYREKWSTRTQAQLVQDGMWQYAVEAAAGSLKRPVSSALYDFAACSLTGRQGRPCPGTELGGQCFLKYKCLKPSEVSGLVLNDDGTLPGAVSLGWTITRIAATAAGVLFGGAALWAAWTLYNKRKKGRR